MTVHMNFRPRLFDTLPGYNATTFAKDLGAGITVGIVALPLAIAIAIASGLPPASGLWAAIVGGLVVALFGGSNVQIAEPANAFIVVVLGIVLARGVMGLPLRRSFCAVSAVASCAISRCALGQSTWSHRACAHAGGAQRH